ncbi:MAG: metallophosphoesterase [Ignavibacteria bacterium]|nr:metallophosphoesterase [Ignavibacteria bacterium]
MTRFIKKALKYIGIAILVCIVYAYFEARFVRTRQLTLYSTDLPTEFEGYKIVFISDIHHGIYLSRERLEDVVAKINNLHPDIVLLGGDYCHLERVYIENVFSTLKKLQPTGNVFGVMGNHDHWVDYGLARKCMDSAGIKCCDNISYWVHKGKDSIKIGGVGDLWLDRQLPENTTFDVHSNDFCILISHNPDFIPKIDTSLVDLTLCGHTHGGQVTFFGLYAPILPIESGQKFRYGLVSLGKMQAYITSGIGVITPPLRFFCPPEIVQFTLRKN